MRIVYMFCNILWAIVYPIQGIAPTIGGNVLTAYLGTSLYKKKNNNKKTRKKSILFCMFISIFASFI